LLLKEAMLKHSATSKGFLIDGYPRELDQGKRFEADVAAVECVVYFEVNVIYRMGQIISPYTDLSINRFRRKKSTVILHVH